MGVAYAQGSLKGFPGQSQHAIDWFLWSGSAKHTLQPEAAAQKGGLNLAHQQFHNNIGDAGRVSPGSMTGGPNAQPAVEIRTDEEAQVIQFCIEHKAAISCT